MFNLKSMLLIFVFLFIGCNNTPKPKENKDKIITKATIVNSSKPEKKDNLSVYGIVFNKKFNGSKATRPYHLNSDKNIVFKIGEETNYGLWYVLMVLDPATKHVNEISFHLGRDIIKSKKTCLNTKNKILNSFFNQYGGILTNQTNYQIEKDILTGRSIKSKGTLLLKNSIITANCSEFGSYNFYETINIKKNKEILKKEQEKSFNDIHSKSSKN